MEKAIINAVNEKANRCGVYYAGLKIVSLEFTKTREGFDKYVVEAFVTLSYKTSKTEDHRVVYKVYFYSDLTVDAYFERDCY